MLHKLRDNTKELNYIKCMCTMHFGYMGSMTMSFKVEVKNFYANMLCILYVLI